jgi:hypothetical protein
MYKKVLTASRKIFGAKRTVNAIEELYCIFCDIGQCCPLNNNRVSLATQSQESKIWSWVPRDPKARMTVLTKVRSALPETWKLTDVWEEYIAYIFRAESKPNKKPAWSRQQADFCLLPASCWYLPWLILSPWKLGRHVPSKCLLTSRRYIPEDRTLHSHRCENLKSNRSIDSKKYLLLR